MLNLEDDIRSIKETLIYITNHPHKDNRVQLFRIRTVERKFREALMRKEEIAKSVTLRPTIVVEDYNLERSSLPIMQGECSYTAGFK